MKETASPFLLIGQPFLRLSTAVLVTQCFLSKVARHTGGGSFSCMPMVHNLPVDAVTGKGVEVKRRREGKEARQ